RKDFLCGKIERRQPQVEISEITVDDIRRYCRAARVDAVRQQRVPETIQAWQNFCNRLVGEMLQHVLGDQQISGRKFRSISGIEVKGNVWSRVLPDVLLNNRTNDI